MDISDLTDAEHKKCVELAWALRQVFATRANTKDNLEEFAKVAKEGYQKLGFVIDVDTMPCVIADQHGRTGPPEIVVIRRLNPETTMDHEYKRWEVLKAKERGEKFLGEKGGRTGAREPGNS
jgi:hypothetical protein